MSARFAIYAYLLAAVLFVLALKAMGSPRTARRGNAMGALGMLIAILATLLLATRRGGELVWYVTPNGWWIIAAGVLVGAAIGAVLALKVQMTGMPQMVAMFNGLGGLASGLVVLANVFQTPGTSIAYAVAAGVGTLIGWVTLTGSLVAFAKLQGVVLPGQPVTFPLQKFANFALLAGAVVMIVLLGIWPELTWLVIPVAVAAAVLGVLFTIPIGGADMPVVISLLNSYSGLAAAATGFVLGNPGLIIAGSLVGASGIVLTRIMCNAMNRSLANVLFAAVGKTTAGAGDGEERHVRSWTAEDAAMVLQNASLVVVVPGYGMAVAQAQHAVKELADMLEKLGVDVKFGIHPVAGRMPGHMNVLLAEAEVPYERLFDMDEINPELDQADVALVIGANDVVNPAARSDENSPIYGMPILNVDHANTVLVCKRSLRPGFAGVDNELFYQDNTSMLFGDAKEMMTSIAAALKELAPTA
jgi:NAD(P) transhydrogenase subunit beta